MKIKINDIPDEGLRLDATALKDRWFGDLLKVFGGAYHPGSLAELQLQISKTCENVFISGQVTADLQPECDRCLAEFTQHFVASVRLHLTPKTAASPEEDSSDDEVLEDEDFAFYQNHEIQLDHFLRETITLEIPLRQLCKEDCLGLCPRCGKNLNTGKCGC